MAATELQSHQTIRKTKYTTKIYGGANTGLNPNDKSIDIGIFKTVQIPEITPIKCHNAD